MTNKKFDPNKLSHRLIVSGLVSMVDDDGLTLQEAQEVLEDIKRQTCYALLDRGSCIMTKEIPFYERVDADKAEIIEAIKFQIRLFVEDEIEKDNDVSWRDFVAKHSEWNHEPLYEIIVEEIVRVMKLIGEESRNHV